MILRKKELNMHSCSASSHRQSLADKTQTPSTNLSFRHACTFMHSRQRLTHLRAPPSIAICNDGIGFGDAITGEVTDVSETTQSRPFPRLPSPKTFSRHMRGLARAQPIYFPAGPDARQNHRRVEFLHHESGREPLAILKHFQELALHTHFQCAATVTTCRQSHASWS